MKTAVAGWREGQEHAGMPESAAARSEAAATGNRSPPNIRTNARIPLVCELTELAEAGYAGW